MRRKTKSGRTRLKTNLALPDLEHAKIAVIWREIFPLGRLRAADSKNSSLL
jgi:hypothetical protein